MRSFAGQDAMAWETQGALADRSREHLGASDTGVVMLRNLLRLQLEKVARGEDPMGVLRDPARNRLIEFKVEETNRETGAVTRNPVYPRRSFAAPIADRDGTHRG
jgi:5,5'-dehydrodivanillate O-demethylase